MPDGSQFNPARDLASRDAGAADDDLLTALPPDGDPIAFTGFNDQAAAKKFDCQATLPELANLIARSNAPDKCELPWLVLGRFGDERSDKGCLRHKAILLGGTGIESEYDGKLVY
jgi:hypothetical protein